MTRALAAAFAIFVGGFAAGWAMQPVPLNLAEPVNFLRHLIFRYQGHSRSPA